jgi:hypothetical protein
MTTRTTFLLSNIMAVCLITIVAIPSVVHAQDAKVGITACVSDVRTYCGLAPRETVQACIKTRFREFSLPCQLAAVKYAAFRRSCERDVKKHCLGIAPGEGRIEACMKDHFADLSKECTKTISQAAGKAI